MNVSTTAPWRRAPGLLLRRPVVAVAVAVASAVLAIAAASGVLFLSSVGSAALHAQAASDCPESALPGAGVELTSARTLAGTRAAGATQFRAAELPDPYTVTVAQVSVLGAPAVLFGRAGALDHVVKLTGASGGAARAAAGGGVWIPDDFAARGHLHVGSRLRTSSAVISVAGIYRSLARDPFSLSQLPRYWCTWHDLIVPRVVEAPLGPLFITDDATLAAAAASPIHLSWYAPVAVNEVSLPQSRKLNRRATQAVAALNRRAIPAAPNPGLSAQLDAAGAGTDGIGGAVLPLDLAGVLVAGLLVAGAGAYWATLRAAEIRLLVSRGVGPGGLALKAVLETALPALAGLCAGYAAALELVRGTHGRGLGPSPVLAPGVALRAFVVAAGAEGGGLLVVACIGAAAARSPRTRRLRWRYVPAELIPVAAAVGIAVHLHSSPAARLEHGVISISPDTFVLPLLTATAVLAVAARLALALLPRVARRQRRGIAGFLAVHRLAASRAVTIALLGGVAAPCALLFYAGAVSSGLRADIAAKTQTFVGADHVLEVTGPLTRTPRLQGAGTVVTQIDAGAVLPDGSQVRILGVDPTTFGAFAHTDAGERRLVSRLARRLPAPPTAAAVPALMVNGAGLDVRLMRIGRTAVHLDVAGHAAIFPGLRDRYRPLLVVDRRALANVDPNIDVVTQIWTTDAQYPAALRALAADRSYSILVQLSGDVVIGNTGLLPLTWMFGYLDALAVLIGLVAVVGIVFALAARTRRRAASYVLSTRMGLQRSAHLRSLLIELLLVVAAGWVLAALVGFGSAAFVSTSLDVYPTLLPPPELVVPGSVLLGTAVAAAGVAVIAAVATHRLAQHARPADVLRLM